VLLRRSSCCDGVAGATELLVLRSCADQLRRAHSARRVRWFKFQWSWPTVLGHPPGPV